MSGSTDTMARRVLHAVGQGALAEDARFATNASRLANDAALDALIGDAIGAMDQAECLTLFRSKGVTVGPIYDAAQLLADAHVAARGCYVDVQDADGTVVHNVTPRLSGTPGSIRQPAPAIGQHTLEVLREAGTSEAEVQALTRAGAIRCA
jgi:crotonobetainyl-CoA:carnitine CoA-transferase CaiB-like acyl-CoA transferase